MGLTPIGKVPPRRRRLSREEEAEADLLLWKEMYAIGEFDLARLERRVDESLRTIYGLTPRWVESASRYATLESRRNPP